MKKPNPEKRQPGLSKKLQKYTHPDDERVVVVPSQDLFVLGARARATKAVIWERQKRGKVATKKALGHFWDQVVWPPDGEPVNLEVRTDNRGHFRYAGAAAHYEASDMLLKMAKIFKDITRFQSMRISITDEPKNEGLKTKAPTLLCSSFTAGLGWASLNPSKRHMIEADDWVFMKEGSMYHQTPIDPHKARMVIKITPSPLR